MSSAALSAKTLLAEIGWSEPKDMTMEEIAWACGLIVTRKEMDGCEGRILTNKDSGIITINSNITYQPKVNYILAHEIGHSKLHREISFFSDNQKTLADWYSKGSHELEANQFAAELLLPTENFLARVNKRNLSVQLIEDVASYFGASKTATFLRYRDLGDFPLMVVFIEKGLVKWKTSSSDFPFQWLPLQSKLPECSVAGDYYYKNVEAKSPEKINAIDWFPDDYRAQKDESQKLWEQCFPASKDSIVTCLWAL